MFQIWTSVIVKTKEHPRYGQAGSIQSAEKPGGVYDVKFDIDSELVEVNKTDLRAL